MQSVKGVKLVIFMGGGGGGGGGDICKRCKTSQSA